MKVLAKLKYQLTPFFRFFCYSLLKSRIVQGKKSHILRIIKQLGERSPWSEQLTLRKYPIQDVINIRKSYGRVDFKSHVHFQFLKCFVYTYKFYTVRTPELKGQYCQHVLCLVPLSMNTAQHLFSKREENFPIQWHKCIAFKICEYEYVQYKCESIFTSTNTSKRAIV